MPRLATVHSLVHFDNLTSPVPALSQVPVTPGTNILQHNVQSRLTVAAGEEFVFQ